MELREYGFAESNFKRALELDYRDPAWCAFISEGIYEKTQRIDTGDGVVSLGNRWQPIYSGTDQDMPSC